MRGNGCLLFDWGNTLMREFAGAAGPMVDWPRVAAMPGAVEALTLLRRERWLALATNAVDSDEAQIRGALARVGLEVLLDAVYCFRRIGHRKPSEAFFRHILADLGIGPDRVIMIGDDFDADVLGANRAGLRAVWFNERTAERLSGPLYRTIHHFDELAATLLDWPVIR